jgi:hypothetical protein
MSAIPVTPPRRLSAIEAAQEAIGLVQGRLFPFRIERWLPLGFLAFLDQCGRGQGGGGLQVPGGGGGGGGDGSSGPGDVDFSGAREWIDEHLALIVLGAAFVLLLVVTLMAVVLWINSRGVFMYLDNVASGRFDVARPWREHGDKAWSYFGWSFGASLLTLAGVLALLVPIGWLVVTMVGAGEPSCGAIAGIGCVVLVLIAFAVVMGLFSVLLRDFAAPLQLLLGVRCGTALGIAWGLVKGNLLAFFVYLLLKIVFGIAAAIVQFVTGCATCCIGFLPVISHTLLQPLWYFERSWSLFMLRQAGYDVFLPPPPAPQPPPAVG